MRHKAITYIISFWSVATLVSTLFISCDEQIQPLPLHQSDTLKPTEVSLNTTILLSDSALMKIQVKTPKLLRFTQEEKPYVEFPEGLTLLLYDSLGEIESSLTALYGVHYTAEKRVLVKNNVVVENNRGETLNTEKLTWLRDEKRIFTDEFVKITTEDEIIYGKGLESNESFTKYKIKDIKGSISANTEDEEL